MHVRGPAWLFGAVILLVAEAAAAQVGRPANIALLPPQPAAGDLVVLRHDIPACEEQHVVVEPAGPASVRVTIFSSDTCDRAVPARVAFHELGRFAAGVVEITYLECAGLPPPPVPLCRVLGIERLAVGGGLPREVPAGGGAGALLLALSLVAAGRAAVRRAR